jgi:hypothetical protein
MLHSQEGVTETVEHLRSMADAEIARLRAALEEVAGRVAPGRGVAAAVVSGMPPLAAVRELVLSLN